MLQLVNRCCHVVMCASNCETSVIPCERRKTAEPLRRSCSHLQVPRARCYRGGPRVRAVSHACSLQREAGAVGAGAGAKRACSPDARSDRVSPGLVQRCRSSTSAAEQSRHQTHEYFNLALSRESHGGDERQACRLVQLPDTVDVDSAGSGQCFVYGSISSRCDQGPSSLAQRVLLTTKPCLFTLRLPRLGNKSFGRPNS